MNSASNSNSYGADENNFSNISYGSEEVYCGSILNGSFGANVYYGVADNCNEVIHGVAAGGSGRERAHRHSRREYACVDKVVQDGGDDDEDECD